MTNTNNLVLKTFEVELTIPVDSWNAADANELVALQHDLKDALETVTTLWNTTHPHSKVRLNTNGL
jgi:hypothetical protein